MKIARITTHLLRSAFTYGAEGGVGGNLHLRGMDTLAIRVETDKLISEGVLIIVATLRFDVKWGHEPAVVKAVNVKVAS